MSPELWLGTRKYFPAIILIFVDTISIYIILPSLGGGAAAIYNSVSIYLDSVVDWVNCLRGWAEDEVRSNVNSGCVNYKRVGGDA